MSFDTPEVGDLVWAQSRNFINIWSRGIIDRIEPRTGLVWFRECLTDDGEGGRTYPGEVFVPRDPALKGADEPAWRKMGEPLP